MINGGHIIGLERKLARVNWAQLRVHYRFIVCTYVLCTLPCST
jgi:hypothetical protein